MISIKRTVLCISALLLVGCSGANGNFGLSKRPPDEFRVISNPPLYVPPSFDLNDPNKSSAKAIQADKSELNSSERKFLQALDEPKSAREEIEDDEAPQGVTRKFFSKIGKKSSADVIDPGAEKERINKNKAEGKPINEGNVKSRKEGGSTIDKLLGNDQED